MEMKYLPCWSISGQHKDENKDQKKRSSVLPTDTPVQFYPSRSTFSRTLSIQEYIQYNSIYLGIHIVLLRQHTQRRRSLFSIPVLQGGTIHPCTVQLFCTMISRENWKQRTCFYRQYSHTAQTRRIRVFFFTVSSIRKLGS